MILSIDCQTIYSSNNLGYRNGHCKQPYFFFAILYVIVLTSISLNRKKIKRWI